MPFPVDKESPYDAEVARLTAQPSDDWAGIMDFCDKIKGLGTANACLNALVSVHKSIRKDVQSGVRALVLLHACVQNCGRLFVLQVASTDYVAEIKRLLELRTGTPAKVCTDMKKFLVQWDKEFTKQGREFHIFALLVQDLARDGHEIPGLIIKPRPNQQQLQAQNRQTELARERALEDNSDADMRRAIELSLQQEKMTKRAQAARQSQPQRQSPAPQRHSPSPRRQPQSQPQSQPSPEPQPVVAAPAPVTKTETKTFVVKALYDFAAKEENELDFKAGAMVTVTNASHEKWWSGTLVGGNGFEGLFPSNFVQVVKQAAATTGAGQAGHAEPTIDVDIVDRTLELMTNFDAGKETAEERTELEGLVKTCTNMQQPVAEKMGRAEERKKNLIAISTRFNDVMDLYELVAKEQMAQPMPQPALGQQQPYQGAGAPAYGGYTASPPQQQQQWNAQAAPSPYGPQY